MKKANYKNIFNFSSQFTKKNYRILFQLFLLAIAIVFCMEFLCRRSVIELFGFLSSRPGAFAYNILLVYFTLSLSLMFNKRRFWLCLFGGLWLGICIANTILMRYRSMPLTAPDILLMSSVRDIFEIYLSPLALVGLMLLISALAALIIYVWISVEKRGWIPLFAVIHIGALLLILSFVDGALIKNRIVDPRDEFYNLADAYENNGFAYCFASSFITGGVKEPENYSYYEVKEIIEKQNKNLPQTVDDPPNLIFVQLESFFDPMYMNGITYPFDPIPNFRWLKKNYSHGFLSVPCIGAGTANTEFEVLTGMNLSHFGVGEYPYTTIVDSQQAASIASTLWNLGYNTHALHNNNATFYNRHIVYDNLGFQTFTSVEYMQDVSYNTLGWAKDACLTREILQCLTDKDTKDLVFTVSVEPHGRYPKEPMEDTPVIPVLGMEDEERRNGFEYYLYALNQSDQFVGDLIRELSLFPERTMVVFYGDHLPSFNIQDEELSAGTNQTTEYVIWTNYSMKSVEADLQTYQLAAYVMEMAGIHEGPVFRLHQSYNFDSSESDTYQKALRTLEYDMIYGNSYALEGELNSQGGLFRLGVSDVLLMDVIPNEEEGFSVRGENFTPYSVVYVNDTPCETIYVSSDTLKVENTSPVMGDQVFVGQVSAVDPMEILSSSSCFVIGGSP